MTPLTEFLTARIAEDEAAAQRLLNDLAAQIAGEYTVDERGPFTPSRLLKAELWAFYAGQSRWRNFARGQAIASLADPTRVLAECEAKRQIVAIFEGHPGADPRRDGHWNEYAGMNAMLVALALPYADHPDYREEWRP
jgi:hypothetical protein